MNLQEKLTYIEDYLSTYFDEMLVKDIIMIKDKDLHFTLPYILLASAGVDFLGGLAKGFREKSGRRSCYFIKEWMGRVNELYGYEGMSEIIYNLIRCGSSHQGIYKKGVESSSEIYPRDKHLHLRSRPGGEDRIFIHALQFADDFIEAQKLYRKEYINQNIDTVHENLLAMLQEEKMKGFVGLVSYLRSKGLTFKDECVPSPSAAPED